MIVFFIYFEFFSKMKIFSANSGFDINSMYGFSAIISRITLDDLYTRFCKIRSEKEESNLAILKETIQSFWFEIDQEKMIQLYKLINNFEAKRLLHIMQKPLYQILSCKVKALANIYTPIDKMSIQRLFVIIMIERIKVESLTCNACRYWRSKQKYNHDCYFFTRKINKIQDFIWSVLKALH